MEMIYSHMKTSSCGLVLKVMDRIGKVRRPPRWFWSVLL